jgi:hypothetical protein
MSEETMVEVIQMGADLQNRSVGNLVSTDIAVLLDHTWSLLPEKNVALINKTLYTLTEYGIAIQKMSAHLSQLKAETLFLSFRGLPSKKEMETLQQRCAKNLETVTLYMQARLLSVAIVACFACMTGGANAPKTFFFGDLPTVV